ncbi:hypothetical protein A3F55_00530 [Candidatus Adlerbacteria bacterium RIFCSPHIGHO2_12_FULL_53_18]|uniref:Uncharacterized protein n=2 Tax=Parcubacteria group TaxID=1794811 RepID=A0A1F4XRV4_9BACT|nr:MAG: hypothetical protein A3F55_00530 [Candidatus Adlerbacteria bacterium RIFCSPHIGHO2_12_FULL_53_18]OGG49792.1 MAG: hypothetical protein A2704_01890 [Candidatus Kaiserbacteria bacterium RIFCSPHIGHO2_01_FULL_54_36b]
MQRAVRDLGVVVFPLLGIIAACPLMISAGVQLKVVDAFSTIGTATVLGVGFAVALGRLRRLWPDQTWNERFKNIFS